ncbi:MAG: alpha/beta fold hydrolase [Pseudomonadota bacterium]
MKAAETDILIVPGLGGGTPDHWYNRWHPKLSTAQVVQQASFDAPDRDTWVTALNGAISGATRPVILIGHSLGALTIAHALAGQASGAVHGAFIVAPPDPDVVAADLPQATGFSDVPTAPLPFPSLCIASRTDRYCSYAVAEEMAAGWGAMLVDAGDSGHLNPESGHGPWPEGTFLFAKFIARLTPRPENGADNEAEGGAVNGSGAGSPSITTH